VQRLAIGDPLVEAMDLCGFADEVVQHVQLHLQIGLHEVPRPHHIRLTGAESDHEPDREVLERPQSLHDIAIARLAVSDDDDHRLLGVGAEHRLHDSDLLDHLGDVAAHGGAPSCWGRGPSGGRRQRQRTDLESAP
jgi:hypothetical protein